jgi:hypothetical protein
MSATPRPRKPSMQDAWDEVARFHTDADVWAALHERKEASALAAGETEAAERHAEFAQFHRRRRDIMASICGLIDLAMSDPDTMQRLKDRAAEKRQAEESARRDQLGAAIAGTGEDAASGDGDQ